MLRKLNTPLQRFRLGINRHKISLPLEGLKNIGLLIQHKPIRLLSNLGKTSPTLEISGISLIAVSFLGMFPVALTER